MRMRMRMRMGKEDEMRLSVRSSHVALEAARSVSEESSVRSLHPNDTRTAFFDIANTTGIIYNDTKQIIPYNACDIILKKTII